MILLVTTSPRSKECAAAIEFGTGHKTDIASAVPQAVRRLQEAEYEALAIDQSLLEMDLGALDMLLNHCGLAMPVFVNLALSSSERVAREMQVALKRFEGERRRAMESAVKVLSSRLKGNLTAILLNSDLALRQREIPAAVAEKVRSVRELAEQIRMQLGSA